MCLRGTSQATTLTRQYFRATITKHCARNELVKSSDLRNPAISSPARCNQMSLLYRCGDSPEKSTQCQRSGGEKHAKCAQSRDSIDVASSDGERFGHVSVSEEIRGIARWQRGLLEGSRNITKREDSLVDLLLNREEDADAIRLQVYRAIAAKALYVAEKNYPFTSAPYRVIRGELAATDYCYSIRGRPKCGSDTGAKEKLHRILRDLNTETERVGLEMKMSLMLGCVKDFHTSKTG